MTDFESRHRSALGRLSCEFAADWHTEAGFQRLLAELARQADPAIPPPADWAHTSTYWWADGSHFLGSLRIRHELTPLVEIAGHIGYDVAPRERRRGHGTAMLRAALPIAAGLGLGRVLITCDLDNAGSRKIIEANGGAALDELGGKLRYWVPTEAG